MNKSEAENIVSEAKYTDDKEEIWKAYRQVWENGVEIPMDQFTFNDVLNYYTTSKDAVRLVDHCDTARMLLRKAALQISPVNYFESPSVFRVLCAVVDIDEYVYLWKIIPDNPHVKYRKEHVQLIIELIGKTKGRAKARDAVKDHWFGFGSEEEKEGALLGLSGVDGLSETLLVDLGSEAILLAKQMWKRRELKRIPSEIQAGPVRLSSGPSSDQNAVDRVSSLLRTAVLTCDLRDSGLREDENDRLLTIPGSNYADWERYLERFFDIIEDISFRRNRINWENLLTRLSPWLFNPQTIIGPANVNHSMLGFPIIRILHLRQILEAPELSKSRADPDRFLFPDLFLHILNVEPVTYFPELRVGRGSEQRWRARWAESMGETISTLFMEAALNMDLTLLERIREISGKMTADFKSATKNGEMIVYEAKGATSWKTHLEQRRKALKQIGKFGTKKEPHQNTQGNGRAFACSFYGRLEGADQSTLFYVEDPPFGFEDLFNEGWENQARRRHYAAVLQYADQFELAQQLLESEFDGDRFSELLHSREPERFFLETKDEKEDGQSYFGVYDDIESIAYRIGLPKPDSFKGWKLFRGIDERKLRDLEKGRFSSTYNTNETRKEAPYITTAGIIPGENEHYGRGVYSLLSNGSFLALEIGQR